MPLVAYGAEQRARQDEDAAISENGSFSALKLYADDDNDDGEGMYIRNSCSNEGSSQSRWHTSLIEKKAL